LTYGYDEADRLVKATWAKGQIAPGMPDDWTASPTAAYAEHYRYDHAGNIDTLVRRDDTGSPQAPPGARAAA
jgi:hypothetical protein